MPRIDVIHCISVGGRTDEKPFHFRKICTLHQNSQHSSTHLCAVESEFVGRTHTRYYSLNNNAATTERDMELVKITTFVQVRSRKS